MDEKKGDKAYKKAKEEIASLTTQIKKDKKTMNEDVEDS